MGCCASLSMICQLYFLELIFFTLISINTEVDISNYDANKYRNWYSSRIYSPWTLLNWVLTLLNWVLKWSLENDKRKVGFGCFQRYEFWYFICRPDMPFYLGQVLIGFINIIKYIHKQNIFFFISKSDKTKIL